MEDRGARDDRKNSRKRHRGVDSSPSPRPSPKRPPRDASPNDSDGYRSSEEKSERPIGRGKTKPLPPSPQCPPPADSDKHRLLSQVVRPQEPPLRSPTRAAAFEEKAPHWKEDERRAAADKRDARGRHDDTEQRGRAGERRGEHAAETAPERGRPREQRESGKSPPPTVDDSGSHDESKKKGKSQKKALKKGRKEEETASKTGPGLNQDSSNSDQHSPRKGAKKKTLDRKRKRGERESDASEDDAQSKRKRGPRTPPAMRQEVKAASPVPKMDNFSDWSDEEVLDRLETVPERRPGGGRTGRERDRALDRGVNPPPLLSQEPPMLIPSLAPQPLMSQPLLRKPPGDLPPARSGVLGGVTGRGRDRRPRSPSNEAQTRDGPQRPRRGRGPQPQPGNPRERDRDRERERERLGDAGGGGAERKSRIDQLRRGEPSRSTSSDRQDSRSHSSRRSSPDSERQARSRSRAGSYDSRDRDRDRDRERDGFERDRKDPRATTLQNQPPHPHLLQQPPPQQHQQREWEPEPREWTGGRGREPLLHRPPRDPHRAGERGERDRGERPDFEPLLPREAFSPEPDKPPTLQPSEQREAGKADSVDGEDEGKEEDCQSVTSGGEVYEPISDDELDEILNDSQKKEEQTEEERDRGPVDVIDVDWSSLMPKQKAEPRAAGAALLRFTPGAVLLRAGISKRLAGPQLLEQVREVCRKELDHPKDAERLFEHELGALNRAAHRRRVERAGLLTNLGPCCKALCARRDFSIRRQLLKNDKGLTKQYLSTPVVDNELFQMSVRLFKRAVSGQASGAERPQEPALGSETSGGKVEPSPAQVCVS